MYDCRVCINMVYGNITIIRKSKAIDVKTKSLLGRSECCRQTDEIIRQKADERVILNRH